MGWEGIYFFCENNKKKTSDSKEPCEYNVKYLYTFFSLYLAM